MESVFITVLLLFIHFGAATMECNCSAASNCNSNNIKCNTSLLTELNTTFCYIYVAGNNTTASVSCKIDLKNYTFHCNRDSRNGSWEPTPSCPPVTSTTTITTTTTTKTQTTRSSTTAPSSKLSTTTTDNAANTSSEEIYTSDSDKMSTPLTTHSSSVMTETTSSAFTTTQSTERTNSPDNTTPSPRISKAKSEDSGPVVVATVSVFVVVIIALAAVVVFLLWRHRRLKQQNAMGGNSGTSISNRSYEDDHGLDRHISLLDMGPNGSVDSGYAEISPGNLNVENSPGNLYHTIGNLPEEKTECDNGYGHLKIQTTKFIDNNYSHFAVNQNGNPLLDVTYAHTGNPTNAQELKDDGNETTYNHLEQHAKKTQGIQQPLEAKEKKVVDDVEDEYNHAKAGQVALEPDYLKDTYSHLNQTWQSHKLESDNDFGRNTLKEYAQCAKKLTERQKPKQVSRDGYETPTGTANIYFTLEPESKPADTDGSFQMRECSESEDFPYHQYYILEKTNTNA